MSVCLTLFGAAAACLVNWSMVLIKRGAAEADLQTHNATRCTRSALVDQLQRGAGRLLAAHRGRVHKDRTAAPECTAYIFSASDSALRGVRVPSQWAISERAQAELPWQA